MLLSQLIWPQSMTTVADQKNGSQQDMTRCCGALSRKIIWLQYTVSKQQGNIIYVDYERSFRSEDLDAFKIGSTSSGDRDTIEPYLIGKGGGSAFMAQTETIKPKTKRLEVLRNPSDINQTYNKHGELYETHIGPDREADYVRFIIQTMVNLGSTNQYAHEIIWTPTGPSFNPMDMPLKDSYKERRLFP